MAGVIWIDFEDVFAYAAMHARPTGIQRLAYEAACALHAADGAVGRIRFVCHGAAGSFREVPWHAVERLFATQDQPTRADQARPAGVLITEDVSPGKLRRIRLALFRHLSPAATRRLDPLAAAIATVIRGVRAMRPALRSLAGATLPGRLAQAQEERGVPARMGRGDVLLALAAPWNAAGYGERVAALRAAAGVRFAALFYDAIPLCCPQWCDTGVRRNFTAWFVAIAPICDHPFAISRSTCADIEHSARQLGLRLPAPVRQIPIGTGFGGATHDVPGQAAADNPSDVPPADSYVLFVSTIEARKNHILLFRLWQRLLRDLPAEAVPRLVFAGRVGWLVDDLMQQIRNTNSLDGHLVLVEGPSDSELAALYRGCLFTVYPSFYEGWGLPVVESLAFGKPCIAANTSSLPEAGGDLARYCDPDNLHDAYRVVRATLDDRAALAAWQARIVREFRPVAWSTTAAAILDGLDASPVS